MNSLILKFILALSGLFVANNFSNTLPMDVESDINYEKLWKQVEKYEEDNLPKSASEKVDEIYNLALSENNDNQIIKSTIYKLKYTSTLEEEGFVNGIMKLESETANYKGTSKPFMYLLLGVMYGDYYSNNLYSINQRSVTSDFENTDIRTWDKTKFQDRIIKNFYAAMDDDLKSKDIADYSDIIDFASESSDLFPTLYDFVAYYTTSKLMVAPNAYLYYGYDSNDDLLKDNSFLSDAETFTGLNVEGDSLSFSLAAVRIYQKWISFRMDDRGNVGALINADVRRMGSVREKLSTNAEYKILGNVKDRLSTNDKNKIWEEELNKLRLKYSDIPEVGRINLELASYLNSAGSKYDFQDITTFSYKLYRIKAVELLDDIITRFPGSRYVDDCVNLKNQIRKQDFYFEADKSIDDNRKIPLRITFTNSDTLYLTVLKCNYTDYIEIRKSPNSEDYLKELKKISSPVINSSEIVLPKTIDYNTHYTEYLAGPLDKGFYVVFLHARPALEIEKNFVASSTLFVSGLSLLSSKFNGSDGYYVMDRTTGKPVDKAKVDFYKYEYNYQKKLSEYINKGTYYTDKNGYVDLRNSWDGNYSPARIDITYGKDFISENSYLYYESERKQTITKEIKFFTDRAIYRPGQIVYFKGILYEKNGNQTEILPRYSTTVSFQDANMQEVTSLKLTSNEFGSINGSFTIPLGALTGSFRISCPEGNQYIQVEEYKRPMFEVTMLPIEGEYRVNDSVTARGNAMTYAGTALTGSKVTYMVIRNSILGGFIRGIAIDSKEIASGETVLDDEGKFEIKFKAIPYESADLSNYMNYNYAINVSVTDINGETQSATSTVAVSDKALDLNIDIGNVVIKELMDSVTVNSVNASGTFVPANVDIEVFMLKEPAMILAKKQWRVVDVPMYTKQEWYKQNPGNEYNNETDFSTWKDDKSVFRQKINTRDSKKLKLEGIEKWTSGVYRLSMTSTDKWGNKISHTKEFVLFSEKDKKTPYITTDFFVADKVSAQPGDVVNIYAGSSFRDVYMMYDLEVEGKVFKSEKIKFSSGINKITIPIEESHRGGITATLVFLREGKLYTFKQPIDVAWKNKELDIKFVTFRDKTLPGSAENWQLKITDNISNPAQAEFMASLYDASLDIFAKNYWSFSVNPLYRSEIYWQNYSFEVIHSNQNHRDFYEKTLKSESYLPDLKLFGLRYNDFSKMYFTRARNVSNVLSEEMIEEAVPSPKEAGSMDVSYDSSVDELQLLSGGVSDRAGLSGGAGQMQQVQVRRNFNETAFFYPDLVTNEKGEIFLNFRMPESLTKWNFMGMAHTKDLKTGFINQNVITSKELMVMPNMPRFFRENDKIIISAKINNVSGNNISGKAKIEFFDSETMKSLNYKFLGTNSNELSFSVDNDQNISVEWPVSVPEGLSAVTVRIIAEGNSHSDGEERILPVLTNKMLVTESMPLPVRKSGTTNFTMDRLKNSAASTTLKHSRYTLEFTSNPAWYAVQALPYLMEYPYDCTEQVFSRFYANSLATHIANNDPKIKRVFELWKNTPGNDALLSNLEKNQDLKSLMLEETPWLLDARDENDRKNRLGLLFDLNRMSGERSTELRKLNESQQYNGGWPWFKGMAESWYITQHIVTGLGHLNKLGVNDIKSDNATWTMTRNAIRFIDSKIEENYKELKKNCDAKCMEKDNLSYLNIQYLYARSFFKDVDIPSSAREAFDYYRSQATKNWKDKNFYMQGMIALALHRFDDKNTPSRIIASLKEHSLNSNEMGMYWKTEQGYFWYQAPVETQALLIEAFDEIANDKKSVEEMKVWLLKQKQTQDWKTTKATAEAIYSLLLQGSDLLSETDIPMIRIGDMTIDANSDASIKTEAGTGYFKKSWDGPLVKSGWGDVSITKQSNSVSWGSVYWQYFEDLDKITEFEETPLKINKKLFVQRRNDGNAVIVPVESDAKLSVGDKIKVRIEIRVDRDMEYVHLKDMRASCFEPVDYISGYRYKAGLGYYQSIKDASINFFIDYLRKGTYVFEYDLVVSQKGDFSNGVTTIQCMYAPEFTSHSEGVRVSVD